MFRAIPVSNKICFDKDVKRSWKIHQHKISHLRSDLGKTPPQKFQFLDNRPKKVALQEVRNIEIDRENNALLSKIKTIQQKGISNTILGCKTSYAKMYQNLSEQKKKTLNEPYRKRQLLKIVSENQEILKRLNQKRSQYSVKKMLRQRKKVQKTISLISSFPYKDYPISHTPVNLWASSDLNLGLSRSRHYSSLLSFSGIKRLQDIQYQIHSYVSRQNLVIEINSLCQNKLKYRIEMNEKSALQLLKDKFQNKIQKLIQNLSIDRQKQVCHLHFSRLRQKTKHNKQNE